MLNMPVQNVVHSLCTNLSKIVDVVGEANSTTTVFTQLSWTLYATLYTPSANLFSSVWWSLYTQSPTLIIKTKFI